MPVTAALDTPAALRSRLVLLTRVRWVGIVFGVVQLLTYDTMPYPDRSRSPAGGHGPDGRDQPRGLAVGDAHARRPPVRLAVVSIAVDLVGLCSLVYLFAFDPVSALFALLLLVPIEAAMLFALPGAMWAWAAVAVAYLGREWYATRSGTRGRRRRSRSGSASSASWH